MQAYHDTEWGVPHHDDRALFELMTLEGAQAGLSWRTVLVRRDAYRTAYHGFDIERVAAMTDAELEALLTDSPLIRNRAEDLLGARQRSRRRWPPSPRMAAWTAIYGRSWTTSRSATGGPTVSQVPATTPVSDAHEQGAEKGRVPFRRLHDMLCVHAGDWHGGRSSGRAASGTARSKR